MLDVSCIAFYYYNIIIIIYTVLVHENLPGSVRIRCGHSATSCSWSKSDDGSAANAVILDTSSDKYTIVDGNSLDISLDNITGVDGGLYRCVYDGLGTSSQLCVYVYGESTCSDNSVWIIIRTKFNVKCILASL